MTTMSRIDRASPAVLSKQLEYWVAIAAMLVVIAVVFVSLVYALLAFPQNDDLERTAAMRVMTPAARVVGDYNKIDGRWVSLFVQYYCYLGEHVRGRYPVMLLGLLLTGLFGCCCGVAVVSERAITQISVLAGGFAVYAWLWLTVPIGEAFYWFPADMGYWLPAAVSMILLWVLQTFTGPIASLFVIAAAFLNPPLHEVCGSWIIGVLGLVALVGWRRQAGPYRTAAIATVAGAIAVVSVFSAPALRVRMGETPHQSVADAMHQGFHIFAVMELHWRATLAGCLLILFTAARVSRRPVWYASAPHLIKVCLLLAAVPMPVLLMAAVSYSLGGGVPGRLYDGMYFMLAAATATFAATAGFDLSRSAAIRRFLDTPVASLLRSATIAISVVSVAVIPRFPAAFREITPAIRNRAAIDIRNTQIIADRAAGIRDILVQQRLTPLSIMPTWFDITEDPTWYANQHNAAYYNVNTIRLAPQ